MKEAEVSDTCVFGRSFAQRRGHVPSVPTTHGAYPAVVADSDRRVARVFCSVESTRPVDVVGGTGLSFPSVRSPRLGIHITVYLLRDRTVL